MIKKLFYVNVFLIIIKYFFMTRGNGVLKTMLKKIFNTFSVCFVVGIAMLFYTTFAIAEEKEYVTNKTILLKQADWAALSAKVDDKKICYAISYSKSKLGNQNREAKDRGYYLDIDYLGKGIYRVSFNFGQHLAKYSNVFVSLDGVQYELDSFENIAFFTNYTEDLKFIEDLKKTSKILVRATYSDNSYSVDEFTGFGFAKINEIITKKC